MSEPRSTYTQVEELIDLIKAYIKQETVDPLRTLGKRFGLGIAAALLFGISAVFFSLAVLRGIQRYMGFVNRGIVSVVPYVGVALLPGLTEFVVISKQSRGSGGGRGG